VVKGRKIVIKSAPRREGDPARLVADAKLAGKQLGWKPHYADLATIIVHAWKWKIPGRLTS
jgi:UDP-glucose 4-epimerase